MVVAGRIVVLFSISMLITARSFLHHTADLMGTKGSLRRRRLLYQPAASLASSGKRGGLPPSPDSSSGFWGRDLTAGQGQTAPRRSRKVSKTSDKSEEEESQKNVITRPRLVVKEWTQPSVRLQKDVIRGFQEVGEVEGVLDLIERELGSRIAPAVALYALDRIATLGGSVVPSTGRYSCYLEAPESGPVSSAQDLLFQRLLDIARAFLTDTTGDGEWDSAFWSQKEKAEILCSLCYQFSRMKLSDFGLYAAIVDRLGPLLHLPAMQSLSLCMIGMSVQGFAFPAFLDALGEALALRLWTWSALLFAQGRDRERQSKFRIGSVACEEAGVSKEARSLLAAMGSYDERRAWMVLPTALLVKTLSAYRWLQMNHSTARDLLVDRISDSVPFLSSKQMARAMTTVWKTYDLQGSGKAMPPKPNAIFMETWLARKQLARGFCVASHSHTRSIARGGGPIEGPTLSMGTDPGELPEWIHENLEAAPAETEVPFTLPPIVRRLFSEIWERFRNKYAESGEAGVLYAINELDPDCFARTIWAMTQTELDDDDLWDAVQTLIPRKINSLSPRQGASIVWALVQARQANYTSMEALAKWGVKMARSGRFSPYDLSNVIWGFGKAQWFTQELWEPLSLAAEQLVGVMSPMELSNVAYGLVEVNFCPPTLVTSIVKRALVTLHVFRGKDLCCFTVSVSRMTSADIHPSLKQLIMTEISKQVLVTQSFGMGERGAISVHLAKHGILLMNPDISNGLCDVMARRVVEFQPHDLAGVARALFPATSQLLSASPILFWTEAAKQFARSIRTLSLVDMVHMTLCLSPLYADIDSAIADAGAGLSSTFMGLPTLIPVSPFHPFLFGALAHNPAAAEVELGPIPVEQGETESADSSQGSNAEGVGAGGVHLRETGGNPPVSSDTLLQPDEQGGAWGVLDSLEGGDVSPSLMSDLEGEGAAVEMLPSSILTRPGGDVGGVRGSASSVVDAAGHATGEGGVTGSGTAANILDEARWRAGQGEDEWRRRIRLAAEAFLAAMRSEIPRRPVGKLDAEEVAWLIGFFATAEAWERSERPDVSLEISRSSAAVWEALERMFKSGEEGEVWKLETVHGFRVLHWVGGAARATGEILRRVKSGEGPWSESERIAVQRNLGVVLSSQLDLLSTVFGLLESRGENPSKYVVSSGSDGVGVEESAASRSEIGVSEIATNNRVLLEKYIDRYVVAWRVVGMRQKLERQMTRAVAQGNRPEIERLEIQIGELEDLERMSKEYRDRSAAAAPFNSGGEGRGDPS